MDQQRDSRPAVERLCQTVATDPDAVTVAEVFELVSDADVSDRYRLARALDRIVETNHSAGAETVERVTPLFASESDGERRFATMVVEQVAGRAPEHAASAIDELADVLASEDPFCRRHAVWALAHLSAFDPELLVPLVPRLVPGPDQPPYFEHDHVVLITRNVAREDPEAVIPLLPSLFEVLEAADTFVGNDGPDEPPESGDLLPWLDDSKEGVEPAIATAELLVDLSAAQPDAVAAHVEDAAQVLETVERVTVRRDVVDALATLATARPAAVVPAVSALGAQLDARDDVLQARAARALGLAYDAAPDEVAAAAAESLAALEPLLGHDDPAVRVAVASLYSCVAEQNPDAVAPFESSLLACLDSDQETVVASAAIALGALGTADATAALEDVLGRDLDPSVEGTVRGALDGARA